MTWRFITGRRLVAALIASLGACMVAGVVGAETALHIRHRRPQPENARELARETGSEWKAVQITVPDGVVLGAWLFTPPLHDAAGVLVLHGIKGNREVMLGHARYILRSGLAVLPPDLRGHGESSGGITTYGIDESGDVSSWADWLVETQHIRCLYGLGMSLGAGVLLQSVAHENRFRAVAAGSSFASFPEIA